MQPKQFTLKNGLRVLLIDTKAFPTMTTILLFGAGSRYENKINNGIAHFFAHIPFKGSKKYPSFFAISAFFESLGAANNAYTSKDHTAYWVKAPTEHFAKVVDVLSDMILHPLLKAEEIEREKGVIVEEINMYEDAPQRKVGDLFEQLLYGGTPLGLDTTGTKETVTKFTRQTFLEYMNRLYHPDNAVLVVAGGLTGNKTSQNQNFLASELASSSAGPVASRSTSEPRSARSESEGSHRSSLAQTSTSSENFNFYEYYLRVIKKYFSDWKNGKERDIEFKKVAELQKKPQLLVKHKKTEQSHFSLGFRTFSFFDERKYALSVLSTILGGGASSRLFIQVRERRGLCYYISTGRELYHDVGYMVTQAGVTNDLAKIKLAIQTILNEHKKIRNGDIKEEELARAKEILKGRTLLSMEDSSNVASWYGTKSILEDKVETVDEILERLGKVTIEEIVHLAKEIFRPEGLNFALIGPYKEKDFYDVMKI